MECSNEMFSLFSSQFGQTNVGSVCQSFGGVGRNIAGEFQSDNDHAYHI